MKQHKLKWYGHFSKSLALAKMILQRKVEKDGDKKNKKIMSKSGLLSVQRMAENRECWRELDKKEE